MGQKPTQMYKDEPNPSDSFPPHYETYYKQDYERLGIFIHSLSV